MYQRFPSIRLLLTEGPQYVPSAVVTKRCSSTDAINQALSEDWSNAKPYADMPGPKPLPFIGNTWRFIPHIGDLAKPFADLQGHFRETYGIIGKLSGLPGRNDMVFLFDPDEIEKVFRNEGPWPARGMSGSGIYYRTVTRKDVFQGVEGAIISEGEVWQKFRTKVNQIMMQPRATKLYVEPIDAVANDFIKRIRLLRDERQEMPAHFSNELNKWALESIVYIALDTRLGCLNENLHPDSEPQKMIEAVQSAFDSMFKLDIKPSIWRIVSTPTWRKLVKSLDYFTEVALKYINQANERLRSLPKNDDRELTILEKLLASDANPKTAMVMALDMMGAGIDTTAYSTAIVLYFLAKNPEKQQKLFAEIHQHLPDKNMQITSQILNELKYLKACIKESMRLKPIAIGMIRQLPKDMVLSDYRVPKGTHVFMQNMYLCSIEKYFPQADKYIPERWLKNADGTLPETRMTHPFVYMPFGFGARMCLGRRFAELEIETMVTKIVRNFTIDYNYGEMEFQSGLLYTPVSPLKFKLVDRT